MIDFMTHPDFIVNYPDLVDADDPEAVNFDNLTLTPNVRSCLLIFFSGNKGRGGSLVVSSTYFYTHIRTRAHAHPLILVHRTLPRL